MLYVIFGIIAVLLLGLFVYLVLNQRVFASFTVSKHTIEPGTLVYTTYRGDYHHMMNDVNAVKNDINLFLSS